MQITNATVTNIKKVKEGVGEKGPWTLWNVTIDGKKYALFSDNEPKGVIAYAEVEERQVEKDGKSYTNLSLKKIKWGEEAPTSGKGSAPTKTNGSCREDAPYSMLLSYAKDLVISHPSFADMSLAQAAQVCLDCADIFRMHKQPEVAKPAQDNSKYLAWLKSVKIPDALEIELLKVHDVGDLSEVTDRADQESIYAAVVKALKEAEVDPFA